METDRSCATLKRLKILKTFYLEVLAQKLVILCKLELQRSVTFKRRIMKIQEETILETTKPLNQEIGLTWDP